MSNWKVNLFGGTDLDGKRLTWSAVIAGIATFIAIFLVLSLIGFSIGLTTLDPIAENPLQNVGTNVTVWTIIALILSFASGGFISGLVANKAGFLHGFMTWVVGVVLIAILVTSTIGGILNTTGGIISNTADNLGGITNLIIKESGESVETAMNSISQSIIDIDTDSLETEINKVLKDTNTKELQPEYLNNQLNEAKEDIKNSSKNILLNPNNYKNELNELFDKLEDRSKNITTSIDKESISNTISENSDLNDEESKIAVDNIYNEYEKASDAAIKIIEDTKSKIQTLDKDVEIIADDIKEGADDIADTGAKSSLYLFIGLLLALFITGFSGVKGANFLRR